MKRLRRCLFNVFVVVSLLLFVVAMTLWVRSYYRKDDILFPHPSGSNWAYVLKTYPGTLDLGTLQMWDAPLDAPHWKTEKVDALEMRLSRYWDSEHLTFGFAYIRTGFIGRTGSNTKYFGQWRELFASFWNFCVLTTIAPGIFVWQATRKAKRRGSGFCSICGYDLRATPDRCPECGTVPAGKKPTQAEQVPPAPKT